ncbi:MAG: NAD(P)/FAD-dependent oxidoreductase, partial [Candidatus Latescibacteria bacterium]|nr:NAD(P)/FAD-dependent oxidoreductase [Candidatus Latescibacterota bacterium]
IQFWEEEDRCEAEVRRLAPQDVDGWREMGAVKRRLREAIRPEGEEDLWLNVAPSREAIEERLGNDDEARALLFEWSMADFVGRYLTDERLQSALLGQGVIGTNASPFDAGTASVHFHHSSGRMNGMTGTWGYVDGGMGTVSFLLCDAAQEAGAVVATGVPVARIMPGEGVALVGGDVLQAPIVVSNADPQTTLRLLGNEVDSEWKSQVEGVPITGCTVKLNVALRELPSFTARPGTDEPHHYGQVNTPLSKEAWREGFQRAQEGRLPERFWTELYFQSAYDASVSPEGKHVMSVFAQYVPYTFAEGDWDTRRDDVKDLVLASIGRFCSNFPDVVEHVEVMGPPDIEKKVGLSGGHIFQGECLPDYMWDKRLAYQTPMDGVYLCGACTHPGGSVIAVNGRNAAMVILDNMV